MKKLNPREYFDKWKNDMKQLSPSEHFSVSNRIKWAGFIIVFLNTMSLNTVIFILGFAVVFIGLIYREIKVKCPNCNSRLLYKVGYRDAITRLYEYCPICGEKVE